MSDRKTIAVVGGGSAGLTAARSAAKLGARVILFLGDNADMASLCVNRGCMPSKAMFVPIDTMHHARRQRLLRVEPAHPAEYLADIIRWKDREIARFRAYRQHAISSHASDDFVLVRANARFVDEHTLEAEGGRFHFDAAILASGSVPAQPPIPGLKEVAAEVWNNENILANRTLPDSLAVVGAGAIGLEFALRYARLGCAVTVIARSRPLSRYPEAFGRRLARIYEDEGVRMLLDTSTVRIRRDVEGWFVVETEGKDGYEPITAERVLLAAGRHPALESLRPESAGIVPDARGRLVVGDDMRVKGSTHLFAAGDLAGRRMVVHQAHIEAGIAAENAVSEGDRQWHRRADLQVVYSDPEFAYAGITPEQALQSGHEVITGSKESRLVGKLHLAGDNLGFGEMIADADSHKLLGAGLLCEGASDMVHLPGYLIDHGHTVHDGAAAEYYHPTRMEIVSGILDSLCARLGGRPPRRADETSG